MILATSLPLAKRSQADHGNCPFKVGIVTVASYRGAAILCVEPSPIGVLVIIGTVAVRHVFVCWGFCFVFRKSKVKHNYDIAGEREETRSFRGLYCLTRLRPGQGLGKDVMRSAGFVSA